MKSLKQIKEGQRVAAQQQDVISELQALAKDIERCERMVETLQSDLQQVNAKFGERNSPQDEIHYLEGLLGCAKKKLVWEKQMSSLQKRTPVLMQRIETLVNHPESSPDDQTRVGLLGSLKTVAAAMERLQGAKL